MNALRAGDLIQVLKSDDCLIKVGTYGVVLGKIGNEIPIRDETYVEVCFKIHWRVKVNGF